MPFNTYEEKNGRVSVIDIPERLTLDSSGELKDLLKEMIEEKKFRILINLKNTKYVDSSGLGAIVSKISATRANGGDVRIVHTAPNIKELFELTHLTQILKIYETMKEAVDSFDE
jgi:anti-sigma B factor antagonist